MMWDRKTAHLVIVSQELIQEVDSLIADKSLVLRVDKTVPRLLLEASEDVIVLGIELYLVLVQVIEEIIGAKNLGNLDELVRVAVAVEEWLLPEDHRGKHGPQTPHVEAVVVLLEVHQQLGTLEVS